MVDQIIGIDLGGSAIKAGRFSCMGECLQTLTIDTPQPATPDAVLPAMLAAIHQVDPQGEAQAIGVGMPGPVDVTGRVSLIAINLSNWQMVAVADWLEAKTKKPVILANDANCAGLGEAWLGVGCQFPNLILLTLGTGVGGAVILDGKLFVGSRGIGAELGLITLNPDGPPCNSGNQGSLEQYVSVQAIRRRTGLEPRELDTRARSGDTEALAFWRDYGRDLGAGLASLIYVFDPDVVVLGGGISASAEFLLPTVQAEVHRRVFYSAHSGLQILVATLGNQAGMVGAAKLAWQQVSAC